MIWGAIGKNFRSPLIKCSGSADATEYQEILEKSSIIMTCDMKYGRFKWAFMQDGAPCHSSAQTIRWLSQNVVLVPGWPPNSPDLNPIETIWGIMKKRIKTYSWLDNEDVYSVVKCIWFAIDDRIIDSLVDDFLRRCKLVLDLGGESASQHISSHLKEAKEKADLNDFRF